MTDRTDIRLRPDGSIDTRYYMALGRQRRSEAAMGLVRGQDRTDRSPLVPRSWLSQLF